MAIHGPLVCFFSWDPEKNSDPIQLSLLGILVYLYGLQSYENVFKVEGASRLQIL